MNLIPPTSPTRGFSESIPSLISNPPTSSLPHVVQRYSATAPPPPHHHPPATPQNPLSHAHAKPLKVTPDTPVLITWNHLHSCARHVLPPEKSTAERVLGVDNASIHCLSYSIPQPHLIEKVGLLHKLHTIPPLHHQR